MEIKAKINLPEWQKHLRAY